MGYLLNGSERVLLVSFSPILFLSIPPPPPPPPPPPSFLLSFLSLMFPPPPSLPCPAIPFSPCSTTGSLEQISGSGLLFYGGHYDGTCKIAVCTSAGCCHLPSLCCIFSVFFPYFSFPFSAFFLFVRCPARRGMKVVIGCGGCTMRKSVFIFFFF